MKSASDFHRIITEARAVADVAQIRLRWICRDVRRYAFGIGHGATLPAGLARMIRRLSAIHPSASASTHRTLEKARETLKAADLRADLKPLLIDALGLAIVEVEKIQRQRETLKTIRREKALATASAGV